MDQRPDTRTNQAKNEDIQVLAAPGGPVNGVNAEVNADEQPANATNSNPKEEMHHGRHPYPSAVRETPGSLHKFCLTKLSARADTYCFELTAIPLDRFIGYAV